MSRDESPLVREVSPDEGYSYMHRAFLHAFMTHGVLTAEEVKPILAHVMTAHNPARPQTAGDVTLPTITNAMQTVNAKIGHYDFEIRSTKDQQTKLQCYALVNKTSDALTQLATKFSPSEIAYIRRLLDQMFETNNTPTRELLALRHTEASQLARARKGRQSQVNGDADGEASQPADLGISIQEADNVLAALLDEQFLTKSHANYYTLAPRALMELRAYLKETYNEDASESDAPVIRVHDCEGCQEIVTYGVRCNNRECDVRWHDQCCNSFYRGRKIGTRDCPKCKTECKGDYFVGERADRPSARGTTSTGGRRSTMAAEEESE